MTAFNVVRFRVKPGYERGVSCEHRAVREGFTGVRKVSLFKTGEGCFCIIGEWSSMTALTRARPKMIGLLDGFRHTLEDLEMASV